MCYLRCISSHDHALVLVGAQHVLLVLVFVLVESSILGVAFFILLLILLLMVLWLLVVLRTITATAVAKGVLVGAVHKGLVGGSKILEGLSIRAGGGTLLDSCNFLLTFGYLVIISVNVVL